MAALETSTVLTIGCDIHRTVTTLRKIRSSENRCFHEKLVNLRMGGINMTFSFYYILSCFYFTITFRPFLTYTPFDNPLREPEVTFIP